jgi:predicted TIM-barrel fold metal-dependent hydrolase
MSRPCRDRVGVRDIDEDARPRFVELEALRRPSSSKSPTFRRLTGSITASAPCHTALMGAAVFERFPRFRVVFGESGIGWLPYLIDRMDNEYLDQYRDIKMKLSPSEYWRRQCRVSVRPHRHQADRGSLMWGSDYPHPDGIWPDSSEYIASSFDPAPVKRARSGRKNL